MRRGVLVGFGEVARHGHWPAYAGFQGATIVAVIDRSTDRRHLAHAVIPGVTTFGSLDEIPDALSVDFVDICTPPAFHVAPMQHAIERGWHVLCEKPLILDRAALPAIAARACHRGVAVMPVHNWAYAPIIRLATTLLRSGAIGRLRHVDIKTTRMRAAGTIEGRPYDWRYDPTVAGGGILMDHGWHAVYLALRWFGERPVSVTANRLHADPGAVEHTAAVTIGFPSGCAVLRLTWRGQARRNWMRLVGDAGEIVVDDDTLEVQSRDPSSTGFPEALSAGSYHADWFSVMLPDVVAAFTDPARSRPVFSEAALCLWVIQEAYRSKMSPGAHR